MEACWEAWAGVKSFQRKNKKSSSPPDDPGNPTVNSRGEQRSNETHESTQSDPEAQLARKGPPQRRALVELQRESAGGESQRVDCGQPGVGSHGHGGALRALEMLKEIPCQRVTVAGDKGFDTARISCASVETYVRWPVNAASAEEVAVPIRLSHGAARGLCDQLEEEKRIEECFGLAEDDRADAQLTQIDAGSMDLYGLRARLTNLVRMRNLMHSVVPT